MSGLELLRRLRSNGSDVPFMLLADESDVPTAVAAMREGATDFIEKPYVDVAVLRQVQKLLHVRRTRAAHVTGATAEFHRQLARGKAVRVAVPRARGLRKRPRIADLFGTLAPPLISRRKMARESGQPSRRRSCLPFARGSPPRWRARWVRVA